MSAPALGFDAPPGVVAALVDLVAGDTAAGSSVRERLGGAAPLSEPVLARLAEVGATTPRAGGAEPSPALRRAVRALLAARTQLCVRLWSSAAEVETAVYFGGDSSAEGGVGLTPTGDRVRWTFPVTLDAVAELVEESFLATTRAGDPDFGALLDPDAARTLFGILDWVRSGGGALADGSRAVSFDSEEARAHHASGVARATGRLFAPYVLLSLGPARGFDRTRWESAASRLVRAGLLTGTNGRLALGPPIQALAWTSTALSGALHWEVATADPARAAQRTSRIVLALGSAGALALDRVPEGVLLHMPGIDTLRADLRALPSPPVAQGGAGFCRKCGTPLRPHRSFCSACGAPVRRA